MSSTYLTRFPNFQLDPTAPLLENFERLAVREGWNKKSKKYKEERKVFLAEGVLFGFLDAFGKNAMSLQAWQSLCKTIGVPETKEGEDPPLLTSISECKKVLKGVYVNLVDLVDARTAGKVISKKFSSRKGLARYICRTSKIFPKKEAKRNPLLSRFLIVVGERN